MANVLAQLFDGWLERDGLKLGLPNDWLYPAMTQWPKLLDRLPELIRCQQRSIRIKDSYVQ